MADRRTSCSPRGPPTSCWPWSDDQPPLRRPPPTRRPAPHRPAGGGRCSPSSRRWSPPPAGSPSRSGWPSPLRRSWRWAGSVRCASSVPARADLGLGRYLIPATAGIAATLFGRLIPGGLSLLLVPIVAVVLWSITYLELRAERGTGGRTLGTSP